MKTNLDSMFKTSISLEENGTWFMISDKTGFLLKRIGGANASKMKSSFAKYYKPYAKQFENGTIDPLKEKEIMAKVFVESCLVDWKGIEIDGKETPFSKEVAVDFFKSLPDLMDTLSAQATDLNNYKEDLGNS
jgi:regulator of PEP synthase PpsR (kinase-PPPase family)